jgi:hypothetical protein
VFQPLPSSPFPEIARLVRNAWWVILDKTWYAARYHLRQRGISFVNYWVWPEVGTRFNSSLMWGASPYKEYAFGPVRYRRYL